jgi:hypothetical protein
MRELELDDARREPRLISNPRRRREAEKEARWAETARLLGDDNEPKQHPRYDLTGLDRDTVEAQAVLDSLDE